LLDGAYDTHKTCLDSKTWRELWVDYLAEAKRFSSQQKRNIFGNEFQIYNEPDLINRDNLTGYDKKLIGEFIRRHHARLAHEIAFNGLIGKNGQTINFGNEKLTPLYRGMSGIVARSHGMNLRDTFRYLENIGNSSWRNPSDVNIVFLMVVLRIADYVQIETTRVNPFLLKLKTFNSPISLNEHKTHLTIESINFTQPDHEQFYVQSNPTDSGMLVKLQTLFADIQKELDVSWAVLGEVYGFLPKKPKIKFRRITSNLEETKYLAQLPFVPQKISFQVNNELSKLLVAPLYGNRATYGVRELVQNAVDACRERQHLETQLDNQIYKPRVTVSIERINDQESLFKIIDDGKGMDIDEITHYFLNIGVSFRKSLAWRKQFVDDQGHSQVNRNGRFGIGVLAAFLIGEEITVTTRKYNDKTAYSFSTTIDSEFIEIQRQHNSDFEIGTIISLILSNEKRDELLKDEKGWADWYVGESPNVEYFLDNKKHESLFKIDRPEFNVFGTDGFKNIQWGYITVKESLHRYRKTTAVVCNDIIISKNLNPGKCIFNSEDKNKKFVIQQKPSFLFEDPEGLFPIKLDRNDIDCNILPFEKELLSEVAKSVIACILSLEIDINNGIKRVNLGENLNANIALLFSKNGYTLNIDYFYDKLQKDNFPLIRLLGKSGSINNSILKSDNLIFYFEHDNQMKLSSSERYVAPKSGGRIILKLTDYKKFFTYEKNRISTAARRIHKVEYQNEKFIIYTTYCFNNSPILISENNIDIIDQLDTNIRSIQEIPYNFFKLNGTYLESGEVLYDLLAKYIGDDVIIPYNIEERRQRYKKAFEELAVYMDKLQQNKTSSKR
jgi:molecular chaperone HtpG